MKNRFTPNPPAQLTNTKIAYAHWRKIIHYSFTALLACFIFSCSEDDLLTGEQIEPGKHLVFESYEDYKKAVNETAHMTPEQLNSWQQSLNFKSFAVEALNRYYSFDFEQVESRLDLDAFIEANSNYLQLVEQDGDFYLETKLYDQSDRFLVNHDGILQIGDKLHKVFETGRILADQDNYETLKMLAEQDFQRISLAENTSGEFQAFKNESMVLNDKRAGCGTGLEDTKTTKRDRTKAELKLKWNGWSSKLEYTMDLVVRPYKRIVGVWYHVERTITAEWRWSAWCKDRDGNYQSVGHSQPRITRFDYSIKNDGNEDYSFLGEGNPDAYFYDVYVYGDTPSTAAAVISCP